MIKKRIYLLGRRGMLGQMVHRYFGRRPGWEVVPIDVRFDQMNLVHHFRRYADEAPAIFINGIGAIPQKVARDEDFVLPNVLLPLELALGLASQHFLIHPSTDCVFKGDRGTPYPVDAEPDAADAYGSSKYQAERILINRPNTLIVRASIIGPSDASASGLLQWFLAQPPNARLNGFTNHAWNGLTTLQWCVEIEQLFSSLPALPRLVQAGTLAAHSKYEMLCLFRNTFRPDIDIHPVEHGSGVDRRLQPEIIAPDLQEQLDHLSKFLRSE